MLEYFGLDEQIFKKICSWYNKDKATVVLQVQGEIQEKMPIEEKRILKNHSCDINWLLQNVSTNRHGIFMDKKEKVYFQTPKKNQHL